MCRPLPPWANKMPTVYEFRTLTATNVFDLTDLFAKTRGTRGPFPRPFEPIRFFATAKIVGMTREEYEPPLELIVKRNGNGYHIFHNMIKKSDGTVLRKALANGQYDIRVESDFYQTVNLPAIDVPKSTSPESFELEPGYNYPFPLDQPAAGRNFALLRGSLHTPAGIAIANAKVEIDSEPSIHAYTTDQSGQWVLVFLNSFFPGALTSRNVEVVVTPPSAPAVHVPNVTVTKGGDLALYETAFRGWVNARGGIGVRGATVEVQGQPVQTSTALDGSWFYYFNLDHATSEFVDVTAHLPDGTTLTQTNKQVQPRATVIVPPFQFP